MTARKLHTVPDTPPRAIIYTRVSRVGDRGEDLTSPELQERACRDYAARKGYQVAQVLEPDLDRSGRSWSRRKVEAAVQSIEAGDADVIVCWRFSRFTRNLTDYCNQVGRVEAAGGRVESALEEVDPATAAGILNRDVLMVINAFESRQKGESWKETHQRRREAGLAHANIPRFGYIFDPVRRAYVIDEEQAPIVARLYDEYIKGVGFHKLWELSIALGARYGPYDFEAEAEGRDPRAEQQPMTMGGLKRYLIYGWPAGLLHRGGHYAGVPDEFLPGAHPPIISPETWQRFQQARAARYWVGPRAIDPVHWLTGIVFCAACEQGTRAQRATKANGGGVASYTCHRNSGCTAPCGVSVARAEAALLTRLGEIADDVDARTAQLAALAAERTANQADLDRMHRAAARLEQQKVTALRRSLTGEYDMATYRLAVAEIDTELDTLTKEISALEALLVRPAVTPEVAADLLHDWPDMTTIGRNQVLRALGVRIWISRGPQRENGWGTPGGTRIRVVLGQGR